MKRVYEIKKPQKATITLSNDSIIIKKHGHFQKLKGENIIPFSSIASLQFREAKLTVNGMLRFTIIGNPSFRGSIADDNTILFVRKNSDGIEEIRDYIQSKLFSDVEKASVDAVSEIRRFKHLFDDGIISEEEFLSKKKQLLEL